MSKIDKISDIIQNVHTNVATVASNVAKAIPGHNDESQIETSNAKDVSADNSEAGINAVYSPLVDLSFNPNATYDYKIVVDSCCELPEEFANDPRFESVPLELSIDEYSVTDDENFDQLDFIKRVAESPICPKSACPSPDRYMEAYKSNAHRVYCVTLSSKLSGSYNSAVLASNLYEEEYGDKQIHVFDSETASVGELQIAMMILQLEEEGLAFEDIVNSVESFRDRIHTYFVLNNIDTFVKNGRITGIRAMAATTLNIKPVLAGCKGSIVQLAQGIGIKKALGKMVEVIHSEVKNTEQRVLMISHCNAPERAEKVKQMILDKSKYAKVVIINMRGVSTMYANDGGIIVTA